MSAKGKSPRKNRRKPSGRPPRWLVLGALAASTALGGRLAPDAWAQGRPEEPAPRALPARRLDLPLGYNEPSLLALLDATWEEQRVPADTSARTRMTAQRRARTRRPCASISLPALSARRWSPSSSRTGLRVEVSHEAVRGIVSPGVTGLFTASQALQELLAGTGVTWSFTGGETVRLDLPEVADVFESRRVRRHPRRSTPEPLRDTPQTLTVIPQRLIEQQGAATLRDVLRNVTGISIQAGEGGGGLPGDNLTIRGFAARNDIFVDGVRDFGAYSRDPFNIAQVEVTKGPASLYTGRGSTGGSLNLSPRRPTPGVPERHGRRRHRRLRPRHARPQPAPAGFRSRGDRRSPQSPVDRRRSPRPGRGREQPLGRGAVDRVRARTPTRIAFDVSHLDQDNTPEYGLPWVPANHVTLAPYADKPAPVDYDNFYGLTGRDGNGLQAVKP